MIPRIFFELELVDHRFNIRGPFVREGYLWATDARLLVRMPTDQLTEEECTRHALTGRLPRLADIDMAWLEPRSDPRPIPRGCEPIIVCPRCLPGWSFMYPLCPDRLNKSCDDCCGDGWFRNVARVAIGEAGFQSYYLALLERHGVGAISLSCQEPQTAPAYFRTGEVEGLLMPLTPFPVNRELEVA